MDLEKTLFFFKESRATLFLIGLSALVCLLYWPGVTGTFLLDDYSSLQGLGNWGRLTTFDEYLAYAFSGHAGPTGRPISLATFALNADTWPTDPYPFIVTNILIHAVNCVLVYIFVVFLAKKFFTDGRRQQYFSFFVCAVWALHPFQASTVLYIVQRMTLLSAMFMLASLILYLHAREQLILSRYIRFFMFAGLSALAALLALYSKENAILLPVYVVVIESFFSAAERRPTGKPFKFLLWGAIIPFALVVIAYPSKVLIEYVVACFDGRCGPSHGRDFTVIERLFTQQRVVGSYIVDIVVPKVPQSGIFFDNFKVSTGLFQPVSTFIWLAIHISVVAISILKRKVYPFLFFGVLWFYCSHLIESTAVMLELKFDHRNYLAVLGFAIVLAYGIGLIPIVKWRRVLEGTVLFSCGAVLYMTSSLWGSPLTAAGFWAKKNPQSARLNDFAARAHLQGGDSFTAQSYLKKSVKISESPTSQIKYFVAFCETYDGQPFPWYDLADGIRAGKRDWSLYTSLRKIMENYVEDQCAEFDVGGYIALLDAYRGNVHYKSNMSMYIMDELEIQALLEFDKVSQAIAVDQRDKGRVLPLSLRMNRALIFASYGQEEYALKELSRYISIAIELNNEAEFTLKNAIEIKELLEGNEAGSNQNE